MDAVGALHMVNRIYARLNNRRDEILRFEDYYLGKQPLTFATKEWQAQNAARYDTFADNWTAPVVNAESERIQYTGLNLRQGAGVDAAMAKSAADMLHEWWLRNELDMQSSQGWVTTLTARRSFVIVWADAEQKPVVTWEHPSQVEIEYDFANPLRREAALKTWLDEQWEYATLYTPDWIFKFQRGRSTIKDDMESQAEQARSEKAADGGWIMREVAGESWPLPNPLGVVPVVEVPNRPPLKGDPISEIAGVVSMQDAINLLWAYLFLAADYASMPARVVLGSAPPMIPVLDAAGKQVGEKPVDMKELSEKRLFYVNGDDPKIDSWEAARLDVFTDTIDVAVAHISSQTRTPPTYLVTKTGMSNVNGEGLKASEIGLNKKVTDFEVFASPAMREVNRLIALVLDQPAIADQVSMSKVSWMNPEIRSEGQLADMLVKKRSIGYPFEYLLELDGVGPLERQRIIEMKRAEEQALFGASVQQAVQDGMSGVDA